MEKKPRKSASKWLQESERSLISLWSDKMSELRACRKNSHLLAEMVAQLQLQGFSYNVEEVQTKMHNLSARYRKEKRKIETTGGSSWDLFKEMRALLAASNSYHTEGIKDLKCGEIFWTTEKEISIHCSLCEEAYNGFEAYRTHLDKHLPLEDNMDIAPKNDDTYELSNAAEECEDNFLLDIDEFPIETTFRDDVKCEILQENSTPTKSENHELDFKDKANMGHHYRRHLNSNKQSSLEKMKPIFEQIDCNNKNERLKNSISKKQVTETKEHPVEELPAITPVRDVKRRKVFIAKSTPEGDRKYKCPICGSGFKDRHNMKHHYQRHSDEKNYACSDCTKRFYSSTELNTHRKVHTGERTYLCTECGKAFATSSRFSTHLKKHKGQRDYHCQYSGCKKSFFCSTQLKDHMLTHSNERHLKCPVCDAGFKQRVALKNHIKLHENKREFKCKICDAAFNQNAGLFSHMKSVHKPV